MSVLPLKIKGCLIEFLLRLITDDTHFSEYILQVIGYPNVNAMFIVLW